MTALSRATFVTKQADGTYLTICKPCGKRQWKNARGKHEIVKSEFDRPTQSFGTKPEANNYLREHEATAVHVLCLSWAQPRETSDVERKLAEIFDNDPDAGACETCGKHHGKWVDCDGEPIGR